MFARYFFLRVARFFTERFLAATLRFTVRFFAPAFLFTVRFLAATLRFLVALLFFAARFLAATLRFTVRFLAATLRFTAFFVGRFLARFLVRFFAVATLTSSAGEPPVARIVLSRQLGCQEQTGIDHAEVCGAACAGYQDVDCQIQPTRSSSLRFASLDVYVSDER